LTIGKIFWLKINIKSGIKILKVKARIRVKVRVRVMLGLG